MRCSKIVEKHILSSDEYRNIRRHTSITVRATAAQIARHTDCDANLNKVRGYNFESTYPEICHCLYPEEESKYRIHHIHGQMEWKAGEPRQLSSSFAPRSSQLVQEKTPPTVLGLTKHSNSTDRNCRRKFSKGKRHIINPLQFGTLLQPDPHIPSKILSTASNHLTSHNHPLHESSPKHYQCCCWPGFVKLLCG